MNPKHFKETLEQTILPKVQKPGRYVGNEVNMIRKPPDKVDLRIALAFPDVYEVGMSYMGYSLLYHILNQPSYLYAERVYAPWIDMESALRQRDLPLYTLETFTPLSQLHVLCFTLQYELHYTTILNMLDLAGIPLMSKERPHFPLLIGGGPCAYNPEPVADFFDLFFIGDAEGSIIEIMNRIRQNKARCFSKQETLKDLQDIKGVYVPQFYRAHYKHSAFIGIEPLSKETPKTVQARTLPELPFQAFAKSPLVPIISTTHDRISLEIARGCTRGCRFCNAGMIYRPSRQRPVSDLVQQAEDNLRATGYDEISLVSLSTSDYDQLDALLAALSAKFSRQQVNLSFPSLRPEKFTPVIAKYAKGVRKSGLTLAPEAGSDRLRKIINKNTSEEDLLRAADLAFREGWNLIKLYFMIGLPFETPDDLTAIVNLIHKVASVGRFYQGKRLHISISPFVPKPVTPFQWQAQSSIEETDKKMQMLKKSIHKKNIKLSWRDARIAAVEGVLARGDRRLAKAIYIAWKNGARLEGWSEQFDFSIWQQAWSSQSLDYKTYLSSRSFADPLPWDHIDKGIHKSFLKDEFDRALDPEYTPDCRNGTCNRCGLPVCCDIPNPEPPPETVEPLAANPGSEKLYLRFKYRRDQSVRFFSHLDYARMFERALRRAGIKPVFSQGYNPHPKIAYGPSLSLGFLSDAEYIDIQVYDISPQAFSRRLNKELPRGVQVVKVRQRFKKDKSLAELINRIDYEITLPKTISTDAIADAVEALLQKEKIDIVRKKSSGKFQHLDIKRFIIKLYQNNHTLYLQARSERGHTLRVSELLTSLFPEHKEVYNQSIIKRKEMWIEYGSFKVTPMEH